MINNQQFRILIIQPALKQIRRYSIDGEETLIATLAQESLGCSYLAQLRGIAVGPFMVEPDTYKSTLAYINRDMDLRIAAYSPFGYKLPPPIDVLTFNLRFAAIICYLTYEMKLKKDNKKLPDAKDLNAIWLIYKQYYNTLEGRATKDEFVAHYNQFIGVKGNEKGNEQKGKNEGKTREKGTS